MPSFCDVQGAYTRRLEWDSFGRLVRNNEPNTSHFVSTVQVGWAYAYDDANRLVATTDARGCGKNIYYDALGRVLAEDFSPCSDVSTPYTSPNLVSGDGTEAFYRYDAYETGQSQPSADYADLPEWAVGRLVSAQDLGSHSRFNYDARGRNRRVSRRLVKPGAANALLANRFTSAWYSENLSFDNSNRLRKRSTTTRNPELLVNGESAETFSYVNFLPKVLGSSYGLIASNFHYLPNHSLSSVTYGDLAATQADFEYDSRDRLHRYHLFRHTAPGLWSTGSRDYPTPGSDTTQLDLALNYFLYDDVGNPTAITDENISSWPSGARSVSRAMSYDSDYRVTSVQSVHGGDSHVPAYLAEALAGDRRPVAVRQGSQRPTLQTFTYDWQGNTQNTNDNESLRFDRSLGAITNGVGGLTPNQLTDAEGVHADYDYAGNLKELTVSRTSCWGQMPNCSHRFKYEWNEANQLIRARRWDYAGGPVPPLSPTDTPERELTYAYSFGRRVLTSFTDEAGVTRFTSDVLDSIRISRAAYDSVTTSFQAGLDNEVRFVVGGRVFFDPYILMPAGRADHLPLHVFLTLGDHLGSTSFVIDKDSSEVVERSAYQPFGAIESDFRPTRWASSREDFKFTGKEEDIEVGLAYFGARYYLPQLGRWASADPLTIHGFGGDTNPYAYVGGRVTSAIDPMGLEPIPANATNVEYMDYAGGHYWSASVDGLLTVGNVDPPHLARDLPDRAIGLGLDLTAGGGHTRIGGSGGYVTVGGVADGLKNFAAGVVMDRVDALQIRRIARIGGVNLDHYFLRPMSKDPNDHSQLTATLVGTAALAVAGGTAELAGVEGALEEAVGGIGAGEVSSISRVNFTRCDTNCVNCAIAVDRTLAGAPASALPSGLVPEAEVHSVVEGALGRTLPTMSIGGRGALTSVLGSMGNGSRAIVYGTRASRTGHALNAVYSNGRLILLDGQSGMAGSLSGLQDLRAIFTTF